MPTMADSYQIKDGDVIVLLDLRKGEKISVCKQPTLFNGEIRVKLRDETFRFVHRNYTNIIVIGGGVDEIQHSGSAYTARVKLSEFVSLPFFEMLNGERFVRKPSSLPLRDILKRKDAMVTLFMKNADGSIDNKLSKLAFTLDRHAEHGTAISGQGE
jgi:hypothetical protein